MFACESLGQHHMPLLPPTDGARIPSVPSLPRRRTRRVGTGTAQPQRQRAGSQELPGTGEPGLDCITAGAVTSTNLLHLSRFASTAPSWFLPVLSACLSSEPDVLYSISLSNPAEGGTLLSAPAQASFQCQPMAVARPTRPGWCPSQPPAEAAPWVAPRTPGSVAPFLHHGTDPGWKCFPNPSTHSEVLKPNTFTGLSSSTQGGT